MWKSSPVWENSWPHPGISFFCFQTARSCDFKIKLRVGTWEILTLSPHFSMSFLQYPALYCSDRHTYNISKGLFSREIEMEALWTQGPAGVLETVQEGFQQPIIHISSQLCPHIQVTLATWNQPGENIDTQKPAKTKNLGECFFVETKCEAQN